MYSLNTVRDYGTILCSAENELGQQSQPCVFHLISAGKIEEWILRSFLLLDTGLLRHVFEYPIISVKQILLNISFTKEIIVPFNRLFSIKMVD